MAQPSLGHPDPRPAAPDAVGRFIYEKLAEIECGIGKIPTKLEASKIRHAQTAIIVACPGVTPWEIDARAKRYGDVMPKGCRLTAHALAANWAKCAPEEEKEIEIEDGPEGWRLFLEKAYPGNRINAGQRPWTELPKERKKEIEALALAAASKLRRA